VHRPKSCGRSSCAARWITGTALVEFLRRFARGTCIFPSVVGRETARRNRKRLLTRSPAPAKAFGRAKQPIAGTAGAGGQRRGHPELIGAENAEEASRVRVAASGAPSRGEKVPRLTVRRTQPCNSPLVTTGERRAILGTGSGKRRSNRKVRAASEIPRPSSRETAKPPRWVSGRGGYGRDQPSVRRGSPLTLRAERTEAGPGREQTCQQNRSDAGSGPRGEVATHFAGLLVCFFGRRSGMDSANRRGRCAPRAGLGLFISKYNREGAKARRTDAKKKTMIGLLLRASLRAVAPSRLY